MKLGHNNQSGSWQMNWPTDTCVFHFCLSLSRLKRSPLGDMTFCESSRPRPVKLYSKWDLYDVCPNSRLDEGLNPKSFLDEDDDPELCLNECFDPELTLVNQNRALIRALIWSRMIKSLIQSRVGSASIQNPRTRASVRSRVSTMAWIRNQTWEIVSSKTWIQGQIWMNDFSTDRSLDRCKRT